MLHKTIAVKIFIDQATGYSHVMTPVEIIKEIKCMTQELGYPQVAIRDTFEQGCICTLIDLNRTPRDQYHAIWLRQPIKPNEQGEYPPITESDYDIDKFQVWRQHQVLGFEN